MTPTRHVVLDARWIFPHISGIGLYTRELMRRLPRIDAPVRWTVLFDRPEVMERELAETGIGEFDHVSAVLFPHSPFSPASQMRLPGLLRRLDADVFHSTNYMIPFVAGGLSGARAPRVVVTIHDLIPLLFPHYTPKALKTRFLPVFRMILRGAARRAWAILTPSRSTAEDVIRELRLAPWRRNRIHVTPEAASAVFSPGDAPATPSASPTILFVGRRDPYKNLPALIRAFRAVARTIPGVRLRVIGPPDPRYPEAEAVARESGVSGSIEWQGYVDGPELIRAYREASVFALPSRYEGFGLPVLEAMACGAPVVCGNASSLPEIAGDAALLVPPDDEAAIAAAILRVLTDPALAADLRARGLRRASEFSWEQTARLTLAAYQI